MSLATWLILAVWLASQAFLWSWYQGRKDLHRCYRLGLPLPTKPRRLSQASLEAVLRRNRLPRARREQLRLEATGRNPQVSYAASVALIANSRLDMMDKASLILGMKGG